MQSCPVSEGDDEYALQESQNLSMFQATQNKIRDSLKEVLEKVPA